VTRTSVLLSSASFFGVAGIVVIACSTPPVRSSSSSENVPSNSAFEKKDASATPATSETREDPSSPYFSKVGEGGAPAVGPDSTASSTGSSSGTPSPPPSKKGPKVSRAECDAAFDRFLELEIGARGLPPEVANQAKEMARSKHGAPPCDATKSQYDCAMAATTPAAWQRCMK
jgi:hypothetical protein